MKMLKAATAICLAASTFCACGGDDDDVVPVIRETGYLSVEFTITGAAEPDICTQYNAAGFELQIFYLDAPRRRFPGFLRGLCDEPPSSAIFRPDVACQCRHRASRDCAHRGASAISRGGTHLVPSDSDAGERS
jgi:hypothetical protein